MANHAHGHGHGDSHGHNQGHGHSHAPAEFGRAFAIGVSLNLAFVIVEAGAGWYADSIALIADAGHNLADVLGLLMAWAAFALSKRAPSERYTYGLRGSSILAALFNAIFLLVSCGAIVLSAVQRLLHPVVVEPDIMMLVAAIGIGINLGTALLFMRGRDHDLNIRGAFAHMAADAAVSAGVVIAGLLVAWTGALWIDPAMSIVIVIVIVAGTWGLFRDSLAMSLQGVPPTIHPAEVKVCLATLPGVTAVHHVHIWPMSTTETALTAHLVMPEPPADDQFVRQTAALMVSRFRIGHSTFQIERGGCADEKRECSHGGHDDHDHGHDRDHDHHAGHDHH